MERPRGARTWLPAVLGVLVSGCGGEASPAPVRAGPRPIPVSVTTVAREELSHDVQGTGSLEAYQVVVLAARVEGTVESVAFDEGDEVGPTRDLAVIDRVRRQLEEVQARAEVTQARAAGPRAQAAAAQAEAAVERARAQERAAQTDVKESEEVLARREALRTSSPGAVPEEEVALKRAQVARQRDALTVASFALKEAESGLAAAHAQEAESAAMLATAQAKEALATKVVADTVVRAPLSGVVRRRHVTLGQYVRAGDPLAEIVDRSRLRVRFRVTESESVRLATGLTMTFVVPSLSATRHAAKLVHVDETAHAVSRMVECLGEVSEPPAALKPGFFVVATVRTSATRSIAVPEAALLPSEQGWVVYVVEDGKARRRSVAVGLRTPDGRAEILDGLTEGSTLVVDGANILSEGAAVAPAPVPPKAKAP